jgi:aminoglycoside phosphotransferase family enzyme
MEPPMSQLPEFITYFLNPDHFNHPVDEVKLVQTHISFVLIAGDFVYKFKKPVNFGFLDFSTLEKRKFYCEEELRLNRRLCEEIYLETLTVNKTPDGFCFAGEGEIVEHCLKMKRMDLNQMMGDVIGRGELTNDMLDQIATTLNDFYNQANAHLDVHEFGTAQAVAGNVLENFDQTEAFIGGDALSRQQFADIKRFSLEFLKQEQLFLDRARDHLKDCHGDLYSANICLGEKIYIFDCIEFNERFRFSDVAADVAFLAMDLDFLGLPDQSEYFIKSFIKVTDDQTLMTMLPFYKCYRAYVRGKIGLFTAGDPNVDPETAKICTANAKKYFALAHAYAIA